ncbi:MAG TPA: hypothetical protein VEV82_02155 [Actinomycetota bacterium]|nr:hypothetical protein [Actinomycetota bacterium]
MMVGLPEYLTDDTQYHVKEAIWDANGTFNGPKEMISDPALRDVILASADCNEVDDFGGMDGALWSAWRTGTQVRDRGLVLKHSVLRIRIKLDANATVPDSEATAFITGGWGDIDDGIPQDGETACTGGVYANLQVLDP